jgi:hypothetical protein
MVAASVKLNRTMRHIHQFCPTLTALIAQRLVNRENGKLSRATSGAKLSTTYKPFRPYNTVQKVLVRF